ncbi:multidrug transporter [Rubrivivax gelatinosus]|uniref:efflux transporter outer membrane subunit n=1 Tax=Rubrivivax gelatinosus TaxID=28068 RepID=UPI0019054BF4|nr:efflux transporter outer membrane subunit [Rubrivivax gelatinosus]MBK1616043.1 multidrug transporter [Rubrivivax gelatinosus]
MPRIPFPMLAVVAAALSGCANLAPNYERPAAPVPASFAVNATEGATAVKPADEIRWQDYFGDDRLRALIELALENNRDLRVAVLNIEQARATYRIQDAERLPSLSANGSGTQSRVPASLSGTGSKAITHQYSANLGVSAYELDLFGRVRNLSEQALQEYLGTEQARRTTQISLVANVATGYMSWAADLQRLALARESLRSQEETLALTRLRVASGYETELGLRQIQASAESARADVAAYDATVARDRNALVLLLGSDVPAALQPSPLDEQRALLPALPVGLSSELLLRRPDVLQAEHQLRGSTANIGAARAAFYPRISLTGSAGSSSAELSRLFKGGAESWSFVPQITLPIFDGGSNRAQLDSAVAGRDIALAQYEKAIQTAFREVADALATRSATREQLQAQRLQSEHSERALTLSLARYSRGVDSYLPVLEAQRSWYGARQSLISTQYTQLSNDVALYKALGGGWSEAGQVQPQP